MRRIALNVLLFYTWLTAAANLVVATGIMDSWGADTGIGDQYDSFARAGEQLANISVSGSIVESFVNVAIAAFSVIVGITDVIRAGPQVMAAAGVPTPIVVFVHAPLALAVGVLLIYVLTGREL
jgi:hypothetical protein